ncbi:MAG: lipoyl synthase [Gammaproteobacteria bacterium]|jgi:lipoyl synthase|nr:lipoyl synthase [Gammaproteobacteria bacterium]MBT7307699.1 lipoyl synthase [Gammaproteobacteria bacterium]
MSQNSRTERAAEKVSRIPIKVAPTITPLRKPRWIRAKVPSGRGVARIRKLLREGELHSVCEEAACPNLGECFSHGTATFMILGEHCTRRCPFCDVAHGTPLPPSEREPQQLAEAVATLGLRYVVITSVDRDDLLDGGAAHFAACIAATRSHSPAIQVEILTPDFRGRESQAINILTATPPDIFNHNLETVPRLYPQCRPGAHYEGSLRLLQAFASANPSIPTKSGLMVGLGEQPEEIYQVMEDLRRHGVTRITLGQYLQPSRHHLPVERYLTPDEFEALRTNGEAMGFSHIASGPMVRSSYHADLQAAGKRIK